MTLQLDKGQVADLTKALIERNAPKVFSVLAGAATAAATASLGPFAAVPTTLAVKLTNALVSRLGETNTEKFIKAGEDIEERRTLVNDLVSGITGMSDVPNALLDAWRRPALPASSTPYAPQIGRFVDFYLSDKNPFASRSQELRQLDSWLHDPDAEPN